MMSARSKQVSRVTAIVLWLIVAPFACIWLGFLVPLPLGEDTGFLAMAIVPTTLAGSALFLLHVPMWQRVLAFVLYGPVMGIAALIISLTVPCLLGARPCL
jgi:hypothetical protein